jgi:hypothetical protein
MVPMKDAASSPDESLVDERSEEEHGLNVSWKKQAVVDFTPSWRRDR